MNQKFITKIVKKLQYVVFAATCLWLSVPAMAQEKTITGTVKDPSGMPIPGVNVVVKGTSIGTVTDVNGKFTIKASSDAIVTFSFVGYKPAEEIVGDRSVIEVTMQEELKEIDQVVVIGYGVQKKSDLTGAIVSVSAEQLQKSQSTTVAQALQGRAAGVQIINNNGSPSSGVSIRIRGITSINGTQPLWIVDGTPASPNSVNPNDIESMEILKDASTAAIYGAQGASGVILVTTKKGKAGQVRADVNYYYGWQELQKEVEMANGRDFALMSQELSLLQNKPFPVWNFSGYRFNVAYPDSFPNVDYQKAIFRTAPTQNIDLSVNGGNEKSNFFLGLGYLTRDGIVKGSNFERVSMRVNSNYQITDWFKVGENIGLNRRTTKGLEEWKFYNEYNSPIVSALNYQPFVPVYDATGNWTSCGNSTFNPVAQIELNNYQTQTYELSGNVFGIIEPIKNLTFETRLGLNYSSTDDYNFQPTYFIRTDQSNPVSKISRNYYKYFGWQYQSFVTYSASFADLVNTSLMAGFEAGESKSLNFGGTRENLINETPEMWYFDASKDNSSLTQLINGSGSEGSGYSYFGRVNVDLKSTLLLQFNIRRDGSSNFGPNNRFGTFPSFSVGFKFTELQVVKDNLPFINFGKIRFGYGTVGNNVVPNYAYFATIGMPGSFMYAFNNDNNQATGAASNRAVDRSMHWETMVTSNLGIDLNFLNNRLTTTFEIFNRYNKDMLYTVELPYVSGYYVRDLFQENDNVVPNPTTNIGKISNKGFEAMVGWKDQIGNLKYGFDLNYTFVKNTAENLNGDSILTGQTKGFRNFIITKEGQPIAEFYGYKVEGIFKDSDYDPVKKVITNQTFYINSKGDTVYAQPKAKPGDLKFKDVNGDGRLNNEDLVALGNPYPKHLFGLNINLEYGWFDLAMFWQGTYGNKIFNTIKFYGFNQDGTFNWNKDYVYNHYRDDVKDANGNIVFPANHNAKYPRLDPKDANGNFSRLSDIYLEDGSYIRLKSIQLGVNLPAKLFGRTGISGARIYVTAQNLLTFTKYSGFDPEVNPGSATDGRDNILIYGVDNGSYPVPRMYTVGATLKF